MRLARRLARYEDVLVLDGDAQSPWATETRPQLLSHLQPRALSAGTQAEPLPLPAGIRLLAGHKATRIDRHERRVIDDSGRSYVYSRLFLALGASPRLPALPGKQLAGVQSLYTRRQLEVLVTSLTHKSSLLIVGGGLLAVELAAMVAEYADVTLVSRSRLLGRYVDREISDSVARRLEKLGVQVLELATPRRLLGSDTVTGLELTDGRWLAARQVVLACGIAPNTRLAQEAGLEVDEGIRVDADMRSLNDASVFAVGDCARPPWPVSRGNIAQVLYLADVALAAALDEAPPASPVGLYQKCRLGDDYRLVVATLHRRIESESVQTQHGQRGNRVLCATLYQRRVVAFQALLPRVQARRLTERWEDRAELSRWELMTLRRLAWLPPRYQADPVICHCANVRRSTIRAASVEHGNDPALICRATRAGGYCGSCLDDIAALSGSGLWRRRAARWSTAATILLIGSVFGLLPVWSLPDSVLQAGFTAYRLMTDAAVREISGYLLTAAILLTLLIRSGRRRYWWHILLGSSALLLLPLHALGGLSSGAGLSASLVGVMLLAVLSGALTVLRRRLAVLRLGHLAASVILLGATLLHVVFIYQY